MRERLRLTGFAVEMGATFLTGIAAVVAAFTLSLPDRSRFWTMLPLPPLVLWLASSGYGCYENWLADGPQGWRVGPPSGFFIFLPPINNPVGGPLFPALPPALPP